jgi:hypothetical protein
MNSKGVRRLAITSAGLSALTKNAATYKIRDIGAGTPEGFLDGSTLRAFRPEPLPGAVIRPLFMTFGDRLEAFIKANSSPSRVVFDAFHAKEVVAFHAAVSAGGVWSAGRDGDLPDGSSYNVYAKVLNLIHTHWCHRKAPGFPKGRHPLGGPIDQCLHVPIDSRVAMGVKPLIIAGDLPPIPAPMFSPRARKMSAWIAMTSIRTKANYDAFVSYFRDVSDSIGLTAVEAFEGFW